MGCIASGGYALGILYGGTANNPMTYVYANANVDANANVTLVANDQIPTTLFYTLDPLYEGTLPPVKEQVTRNDEEVKNGGEVLIKESEYNGKHSISVGSTIT